MFRQNLNRSRLALRPSGRVMRARSVPSKVIRTGPTAVAERDVPAVAALNGRPPAYCINVPEKLWSAASVTSDDCQTWAPEAPEPAA